MRLQKWFRDNALGILSQVVVAGLVVWATISTLFWIGERSARQNLEDQIRRGSFPASGRSLYARAQYGSGSSLKDIKGAMKIKP
ncbi:MAG: hypothetical protein ABIM59_08130 [candidate division WOR-3 bacterium]